MYDYNDVPPYETHIGETVILDYINAVEAFAHGMGQGGEPYLAQAEDRARWMVEKSSGMGSIPDLRILHAAIKSVLPSGHPRHAATMSAEELRVCYKYRPLIGKVHEHASKTYHAQHGVPLPDFEPTMVWPRFGTSFRLSSADDIVGAWALSLVLEGGHYDEAARILAEPMIGTSSVMRPVAEMALYYETQRWTDLIAAAEKVLVIPHTTAEGTFSYITLDTAHGLAHCLTGYAQISLGNPDDALRGAKATIASTNNDVIIALSRYLEGMAHRAGGDKESAAEAFARSQQAFYTPAARQAMSNPDHTLRVTKPEYIAARTDKWDVTTEPDPSMMAEKDKRALRAKWRSIGNTMLDDKIGMESIVAQLDRFDHQTRGARDRARRTGTSKPINTNMVVMGPPGTGKSTTIEAYAHRLAAAGLIEDPNPVFVTARDLIGDAIGQTAIRTAQVLESNVGRLVAIDEAYSIFKGKREDLATSNADSFGADAVDQIVSLSETLIGKVSIVLIGYENEMKRLLEANEGLSSRFPRTVVFPSFTLEQFAAVARVEARAQGMRLTDEAVDFLADGSGPAGNLLASSDTQGRSIMDKLGNGRFARNLIERAMEELDTRNAAFLESSGYAIDDEDSYRHLTDAQASTLTLDDVVTAFNAYLDAELVGGGTL